MSSFDDLPFPDKKIKIVSNNVVALYKLKSIKANQVMIREQPWLWDQYIPLETCTLFAGTGGIGKSQLLLYLASLVSNGSSFSINSLEQKVEQGSVILLSAEDSVESSVVPRLKAVNADLSRIEILSAVVGEDGIEKFICLDNDLKLVEEKVKQMGDVKLIIIDPITAYLGGVKENQSAEVRNFILKMSKIAERNKLAIILNTHTRKKGGGGEGSTSAADEIMGSSAWYNTVRQAYTVSRDHEDKDRILFINCKSNCGSKPESFDYVIEGAEVGDGQKSIKTSRIKLMAGKINVDADEALNKEMYEKKTDTQEAMEFILDCLKFGSESASKIKSLAFDRQINERILKRARQQLNKTETPIVVEKQGFGDKRKDVWYIGVQKSSI